MEAGKILIRKYGFDEGKEYFLIELEKDDPGGQLFRDFVHLFDISVSVPIRAPYRFKVTRDGITWVVRSFNSFLFT